MTDEQQSLGKKGIAEELAEGQRQISIAEFFEKNKHMLGFDSPGRSIVTAVKEGVDNSLDATEEAGYLPEISVEIEERGSYYTVAIEDNGPGITEEQIPKVFGRLLYGSRFGKRKQARGQQGIGISAAVLYSQLTSGRHARITSKTPNQDKARYFELIIDTDDNTADIEHKETTEWDKDHGTRIELEMEANMRARQQLHKYIRYTSVVNPHATVSLEEPKASMEFPRTTEQMPKETKEIDPHPHGVELGSLMKMLSKTDSHSISGFLQSEFTRVGAKTADNIIENFKDLNYGREIVWSVPDDTTELEEELTNAVRNKGKEPTDKFVQVIINELPDEVAYQDVQEVVKEAATEATDEFGKTFGKTVRDNAIEATWSIITNNTYEQVRDHVDSATSNRKTDETIETLSGHINEWLQDYNGDFRIKYNDLEDIVNSASDRASSEDDVSVGNTARENITKEIWSYTKTVPDDAPLVRNIESDRDICSNLLQAMSDAKVQAPPTDCLSPITAPLIEKGLEKVYDAEFYAASTRDADVHSGEPFVAEAGIAYGGDLMTEDGTELLRFANRVPLVYQQGACAMTRVVTTMNWRNYNLSQPGGDGLPEEPMVLVIHVASTNVPFTSESKDAVANVEAIMDEVELAVREASRKLKSYVNKQADLEKKKIKRNELKDILPELAERSAEMAGGEKPNIRESLAQITNTIYYRENDDIHFHNYSNDSQEFGLTATYDEEPSSLPDDVEVEELGDKWTVRTTLTLASGEEQTLKIPSDYTELDFTDIPSELITNGDKQ